MPPVPCSDTADRMRLGLYAKVEEGGCYEDRRRQVPEVFERHFEKDLQNEGMIWAALRIEWDQ
jgi:hypothetical protein